MSQVENQSPVDREVVLNGLRRLNTLLTELSGKMKVRQKEESIRFVHQLYESYGSFIYQEMNYVFKPSFLLDVVSRLAETEAEENQTKLEKASSQKSQGFNLYELVVKHITEEANTHWIDSHELTVLPSLKRLLTHVQKQPHLETTVSSLMLRFVSAVGVGGIEEYQHKQLWTTCLSSFAAAASHSTTAAVNYLKILCLLLRKFDQTVLSLEEKAIPDTISALFAVIKKKDSRSWSNAFTTTVLEFVCVLVDGWGLQHRDLLLDDLFQLAEMVVGKVTVEATDKDGSMDHVWLFFDRLTTLAIPDCYYSSLANERIFDVASTLTQTLITDLVRLSVSRENFGIPATKSPLFARLLVISELSDCAPSVNENRLTQTVKRRKQGTPLEMFCDFDFEVNDRLRSSPRPLLLRSFLSILREVVASWHHRLGPTRLVQLADTVFPYHKKLAETQLSSFCQLFTELLRSGALGNSAIVKSEASSAEPMRDPVVRIKALWKFAVSAAHNPLGAEAAMELLEVLILNFRELLAAGDCHDKLVESVCSVLPSNMNPFTLRLLSTVLVQLEFNEGAVFPGVENRDSGICQWRFRCHIAEWLLLKVSEDVALQLFQLCCYHPQPSPPQQSDTEESGLNGDVRLLGLALKPTTPSSSPPSRLGSCLSHEVLDFVRNLLQDCWSQGDCPTARRMSLFTTIMKFTDLVHSAATVSQDASACSHLDSLLLTVNEWLSQLTAGCPPDDIRLLDPGPGSRLVSAAARASVLRRATECPVLFARFPSQDGVPPSHFVRFVEESASLIRKYGDFNVAVGSVVKMEGESHHIDLSRTAKFGTFLGNQVASFVQSHVDFLPDLLLLFEKVGDLLSGAHLVELTKKALSIMKEDADSGDNSQEQTLLAKISIARAVVRAHLRSGRVFSESDIIAMLPAVDVARAAGCLQFEPAFILKLSLPPLFQQGIVRRVLATPSLWPIHTDLLSNVTENQETYQLCVDYVDNFPAYLDYHMLPLASAKKTFKVCDPVLKRKLEALRAGKVVRSVINWTQLGVDSFPDALHFSKKDWPVVVDSFWKLYPGHFCSLLHMLKCQALKHIELGLQLRFVTFLNSLLSEIPEIGDDPEFKDPVRWIAFSSMTTILDSLPDMSSEDPLVDVVLSVVKQMGPAKDTVDPGLNLLLREKLPKAVHHRMDPSLDEQCMEIATFFVDRERLTSLSMGCTSLFWDHLLICLPQADGHLRQLTNQQIYNYLLFFWDVLPHLRPKIARVLRFFDESRCMRTTTERFTAEKMISMLNRFCRVVIYDSKSVDASEAALKIILCGSFRAFPLHDQAETTAVSKPCSIKSPIFTLCLRLMEGATTATKVTKNILSAVRSTLHSVPILAHLICPYLCGFAPTAAAILLQFIKEHGSVIDVEKERRLIRTLCDCVDGVGLGALATVECSGREFIAWGRLAVAAGFHQHAFALANLAFDRIVGGNRKLAAFCGSTHDVELDNLLCDIYLATENSQALDTLSSHVQMDPRVQLLRSEVACQWLEVLSSPLATMKQKAFARWYCTINSPKAANDDSLYVDAIVSGQLEDGYPKRLRSHYERVFALLRNHHFSSPVFEEEIIEQYISDLAGHDYIVPALCNELKDLHILIRKQLSEEFLETLSVEQLCLLMWKIHRQCLLRDSQSFASYLLCYETGTLILLDKLQQKKAYPAALSVVNVCRRLFSETASSSPHKVTLKECEIYMAMGNHQLAEHKLNEIAECIHLPVASAEDSQIESGDEEVSVDVICLLAKIRADHSPKLVEQALKAMELLEQHQVNSQKARELVFELAVRQIFELEAYMESPMIKLRKEARAKHQKDMAELKSSVTSEEHRRRNIVNKEFFAENEELSRLDRKLSEAVLLGIRAGFALLENICHPLAKVQPVPPQLKQATIRVIFPLIDIIFRYEHLPEVTTIFQNHILRELIPSVWLPVVPHIMPHCFRNGKLSLVIQDLMVELIIAYPYHVLTTVLSYKYDVSKMGIGSEKKSVKSDTVDKLLGRALRSKSELEPVVRDMVESHRIYRKFVWMPIKKDNVHHSFEEISIKGVVQYRLKKTAEILTKIEVLQRVPLPTITQQVGMAEDYSREGLILWGDIHDICQKADGNSSPKILKVWGSNHKEYRMVWKDGESVRQDSLVQDLFSVMSALLDGDHPLRTYNVVPLDSMSGIIEFCGGTQSLKDILIGGDSRSGLHGELHPEEDVFSVRRQMNAWQQGPKVLTEEQFKESLEKVSPVFRHHFYRTFPTVRKWSQMIQNYTTSLAQWSIVCYVVGLGDRHASNVLFEPETSHFVHIDLGMILEFSKRVLPIPELVPFRMTRDVLDPILIQGIRGNLAYEAADALQKIRKHKEVILGVASVFLRETVSSYRDTAEDSQRSFAAATAIARLQAKLNGTDATITPVPPFDQAQRLLGEATSISNLSKLFHGWLAIV